LGKRGLYHIIGGITNQGKSYQKGGAFSWVLNFSDGFNSISDIEKRAKSSIEDELDFETLLEAANILKEKKLLVENISN
jgi:aminopeptidase-like protein